VTELTKTLELKPVDPNAHKREKLRETWAAYQEALQEAFDASYTTLGEVNDIVGDYQLSSYAKNTAGMTLWITRFLNPRTDPPHEDSP
jgi:hypothetical protein